MLNGSDAMPMSPVATQGLRTAVAWNREGGKEVYVQ